MGDYGGRGRITFCMFVVQFSSYLVIPEGLGLFPGRRRGRCAENPVLFGRWGCKGRGKSVARKQFRRAPTPWKEARDCIFAGNYDFKANKKLSLFVQFKGKSCI